MWLATCEMMRITITGFLNQPGKRLPVDTRLGLADTSFLQEGIRFLEEITVRGTGFAQLDTLYLDTRIHTVIERPCSRCLAPVLIPIGLHERFEVAIQGRSSSVDLFPQVMGFILACLDPHPLCRPDCRGLCPICGTDLNQHPDHVCPGTEAERARLGDFLR